MQTAAFDPDGGILATGGGGDTKLWNVDSGKLLTAFDIGHSAAVVFSPDNRILATVGFEVTLREPSTGAVLRRLAGHNSLVTYVAFDAEGGMLATGSVDRTIMLWEASAGRRLRVLNGHLTSVNAVVFHPSGEILAGASEDGTVRLWDVDAGSTVSILKATLTVCNTSLFPTMAGYLRRIAGTAQYDSGIPRVDDASLSCARCRVTVWTSWSIGCGRPSGGMRGPRRVTTQTFKSIKDYVLELKEAPSPERATLNPVELRGQLAQAHPDLGFTDDELLTAVRHLSNHGYVAQLRTSRGESRILLVPVLPNNLAASIILEARRNPRGLGSLEEQQVLTGGHRFPELAGLSAEDGEVLLDSAIAMFLSHSVCFRETDPLTERSYLVFPELINLRKPVFAEEQPLEEGVAYTVSGAVANVYASLVVLLGYTSTFTRTNQWRDHARYVVGDGLVCGLRLESRARGRAGLRAVLRRDRAHPAAG